MTYSKPVLTSAEIARLTVAYQQAIYEAYIDGERIDLSIGEYNCKLNQLLKKHHCQTWALITAANPYSQPLSETENQQRHQKLIEATKPDRLITYAAIGKDKTGAWTPETSLLILGIDRAGAIALGNLFEQNAIVWGTLDTPPELLWLNKSRSRL